MAIKFSLPLSLSNLLLVLGLSPSVTDICRVKVKEYLKYKIIQKVTPSQGQYLSDIFPVAKKSLTDHRIIIDLSDLNLLIRKVNFKMDCIPDIMALIRPGDWFVSIDLSDAYFCIAMHLLSMPYLTFVFLHFFTSLLVCLRGFVSPLVSSLRLFVLYSHTSVAMAFALRLGSTTSF